MQPGDIVVVRDEYWTVARTESFDQCAILTLEGRGPGNTGRRCQAITPFERVMPSHADRPQRPALGLWSAAGASLDLIAYQLEPALAVLGGATRVLLADAVGLGKTVQAGSATARTLDRERAAPLRRFFRLTGIYSDQGNGYANRYQLFLERTLDLTRPGGRFGLLLPSGLATDHGSARLRRRLFDRCTLDTWLGLDNKAGIFPIHRSVRFLMIAATNAGRTEVLRFRSGLQDPALLDRCASDARQDDGEAWLSVSRSRLEAWDLEQLSVPTLTSPAALAVLTTAAAGAPPLGSDRGWHARFGRELNATDDCEHFIPRPPRSRSSLLPIVAGKHSRRSR